MSASALDRQIRPIYDALDTGSHKSAIVSCNKLLKKHPKSDLIKALKALALVRMQKVEESLVLCDEVLASKPTDDPTLSAMMHALRGLGRNTDTVKMFDDAFKKQPANEELGAQTFFSNVRTGNWKAAQQVALKMHKQFKEDRYMYWSVISSVLQARDPATPAAMRPVLIKLAHRVLSVSPQLSLLSADRLHLHLTVLKELQLWDEAREILETDVGIAICATNLSCDELRREISQQRGAWLDEGARAEQRILEKKDRNWLEFLSVLDATFSYVASPQALASTVEVNGNEKSQCAEHVSKTRDLFLRISEEDGRTDRSGLLALLELEKRARRHGASSNLSELGTLMQKYYFRVGDKGCCFEDLRPYLALEGGELSTWLSFLQLQEVPSDTPSNYRRSINVHKLLRYHLIEAELTPELESARATEYLNAYHDGLRFGKDLPETDLQPADDYAILASHAYVSVWQTTGHEEPLFNAASVLEYALTKSKQAFQMRLILIRIYQLLAAPSLALEHYRALNVKQVQNDTLSHFILSRASTFSLAATGDITLSSECLESSQIYMSNSQETADFIIRAFTGEKYSQIPDFIVFEDRLENSLQRDLVKIEHVRMRTAHEVVHSEMIDMELIELKFIFDRLHHDNRDFTILSNYQPAIRPSFDEQTRLFEKSPGSGWLWSFLKIYIRALQQASDLDDTVEDKLLIGDRPKQRNAPENQLLLKDWLLQRKQSEFDELTAEEIAFFEYCHALADWVGPHHDFIRPTPAEVLAEAARQNELKFGHPLKGMDITTANGTANGGRKEEDAPPVKDAPSVVTSFFEDILARFNKAIAKKEYARALHAATMAQEALIVFSIETLRFKPASVVKIHKLGNLVQNFKDVRTKAAEALKQMSSALAEIGESEATAEKRKSFVEACSLSRASLQADSDFVLNVAKKVLDSRKKVLEGIGRGLARVCVANA